MKIPVTPIRREISRIVDTKEKIKISKGVFSMVPSVVTNIPGVKLLERRDYFQTAEKDLIVLIIVLIIMCPHGSLA